MFVFRVVRNPVASSGLGLLSLLLWSLLGAVLAVTFTTGSVKPDLLTTVHVSM